MATVSFVRYFQPCAARHQLLLIGADLKMEIVNLFIKFAALEIIDNREV